MIEVRKAWKHGGLGGAAEGPLTQVWVGVTKMKIDQLEPIDVEPEAFKSAAILFDVDHFRPENRARWAKIAVAAAEARACSDEARAGAVSEEPVHTQQTAESKIEIAPGYGFCRLLGSFLPKKFRELVLEAQHADALQDYFDALESGDVARAKRIKFMMHIWMLYAIFAGAIPMILGSLKAAGGISKD